MKIIKIDDDFVEFDDGTKITSVHYQDCCEHVYADFKQLKDTNIMMEDFDEIKIEKVLGSGFKIGAYFVPCYNSQNGYYNSDLSLAISKPGKEDQIINITGCTEDDFN